MEELDRLESRRGRPLPLRAGLILAAAAVSAALVAVSWSWHPGRHASAALPPGPASNAVGGTKPSALSSPTAAPADAGSVFVQPLPDCLRTDRRRSLRIAMAIQNLADRPLQLVSVDVIGRIPGLTMSAQTVGGRPCADQPRQTGRRIRPGEELVVALDFAVGPACPPPTLVTARLGFLAGNTLLHAETANLVALTTLRLEQCR